VNQPQANPPDPSLPQLRVISGGARKGRSADHLKSGDRPPGRFWDDSRPAAPAAPAPAAPAPVAPVPAAPGLAELLAFMTAQTALMQELLSEQRRLRQRVEDLERRGGPAADHQSESDA